MLGDKRPGNVCIPVQDYNSLRAAVIICATLYTRWRCGAVVECRTCDRGFESQLGLRRKNSGQLTHTHVPLSPSSISWYWPKGDDALRL